jgi:methylmalonyl-CoA carboxyltransferase small subunit
VRLRITIDGKIYEAEVEILEAEDDGPAHPDYAPMPAGYPPPPVSASPAPPYASGGNGDSATICHSPVTGLVIKVNAQAGQTVQPGDLLLVLEAMKMETQVTATHPGIVKCVHVAPGNSVKVQQILLEYE